MTLQRQAYIYRAYRSNDAPDFYHCVMDIIETGASTHYKPTDTFDYGLRRAEFTYADAEFCAKMINDADKDGINLPTWFFDHLEILP